MSSEEKPNAADVDDPWISAFLKTDD